MEQSFNTQIFATDLSAFAKDVATPPSSKQAIYIINAVEKKRRQYIDDITGQWSEFFDNTDLVIQQKASDDLLLIAQNHDYGRQKSLPILDDLADKGLVASNKVDVLKHTKTEKSHIIHHDIQSDNPIKPRVPQHA